MYVLFVLFPMSQSQMNVTMQARISLSLFRQSVRRI
jgi:hypothetical protein